MECRRVVFRSCLGWGDAKEPVRTVVLLHVASVSTWLTRIVVLYLAIFRRRPARDPAVHVVLWRVRLGNIAPLRVLLNKYGLRRYPTELWKIVVVAAQQQFSRLRGIISKQLVVLSQ